MFKKSFGIFIIVFSVFCLLVGSLAIFSVASAQQGCCSGHGGVCDDCRCCDGSRLSAICRPHYNCDERNNYKVLRAERAGSYPECDSEIAGISAEIPASKNGWWLLVLILIIVGLLVFMSEKGEK